MLRILHSGLGYTVIDKPPGIATQAAGQIDSVERRLREEWAIGDSGYLAMVHRLDRDVGGALLVATGRKAAKLLSQQFESRKVRKTYLAVCRGRFESASPDGQERWVDWIRKIDDQAHVEIAVAGTAGAKQAITITRCVGYHPTTDRCLLRLVPETGRTHQLRIQSASRGHAILGDSRYGGPDEKMDAISGEVGIALHAIELRFHDPVNGRMVCVESPATVLDRWFAGELLHGHRDG